MEITEVKKGPLEVSGPTSHSKWGQLEVMANSGVNHIAPGFVQAGFEYLQGWISPHLFLFFCPTTHCEAFSFHLMGPSHCLSCCPHPSPSRVWVHPLYTLQVESHPANPGVSPVSSFLRQSKLVWWCKYNLTTRYFVFPSQP